MREWELQRHIASSLPKLGSDWRDIASYLVPKLGQDWRNNNIFLSSLTEVLSIKRGSENFNLARLQNDMTFGLACFVSS